jgi:ankyrin repeat protein
MKHLLLTTIAAVVLVGCGHNPEGLLRKACLDGNIEAVKQHIAAGVDVNAPNTYGWTALYWASSRGHKEIVELLIANGAHVNPKGDLGDTPLDGAIEDNHTEIADILRKHGGKSGVEHSIRVAAGATGRKGNIEAVKRYLAAGTDVDARDAEDKTPLQHAVFWGNKEIVKLLIAEGADVNAKDNAGTTTLDWAEKWSGHHAKTTKHKADKKEIADLLRKHGGKTKSEL